MENIPSNIRKSMNNMPIQEKSVMGKSSYSKDEEPAMNSTDISTKSRMTSKPQISNSASSQNTLSDMPKVVSSLGHKQSKPNLKQEKHTVFDDKRHDSLKNEVHLTKPLLAKREKNEHTVEAKHTPANEKKKYSQPIVKRNQQELSSGSEHSENKESSSEEDEEVEEEEEEEEAEEEDNEEFPVALNGLVFSFLPQQTALKLNDQTDWK
jgi:hypothetical protein